MNDVIVTPVSRTSSPSASAKDCTKRLRGVVDGLEGPGIIEATDEVKAIPARAARHMARSSGLASGRSR
ncbi:hypothetical protein GCM10023238_32560 [Streptomyces heliomycini]